MNKNIDGFIRKINSINTIFAILLISFPQYIASALQIEIQPVQVNHPFWFTTFVLLFFVVLYSKYFTVKDLNKDGISKRAIDIAHIVSGGILFLMPPLVIYLVYLHKNYGQYLEGNGNIGNVLLLIPFGVTISAAISQSAYIIEKKSTIKKVILVAATTALLILSTTSVSSGVVQISAFIYFSLLFVLSHLKKN